MALVMAFFGLMLLTSVLFGSLTSFGVRQASAPRPRAETQLHLVLGFELLDAALVGAALLVIGRPARRPPWAGLPQAWLWTFAIVGIGVVVMLNAAYHHVLRSYLGVAPERDAIVAATGITPLVLFTYCLQPAVVEELFFRYLALDTLRGVTSVHAAVLISSLMFGMAHVGVPLSIPMLGLVGVPLAYARVASGRLALPMVLHFLHNWIILVVN
jgi:membrane protease YdiL (CAAX protease family)